MLTDTRHHKLVAQRTRQPPRAECEASVATSKDMPSVAATVTLRFSHGTEERFGIAYERAPKEARQLALRLADYATRADKLDGKGIGIERPRVWHPRGNQTPHIQSAIEDPLRQTRGPSKGD